VSWPSRTLVHVKARAGSRPSSDVPSKPDDHLDAVERAVVKALVTILIREIGDDMAAESKGRSSPRPAARGRKAD
jgi:hypothetical protein